MGKKLHRRVAWLWQEGSVAMARGWRGYGRRAAWLWQDAIAS
ncbi:hypothetical protein [Leyella stercorea]|nr:hypothetical protein [Leyella stercorea]